MNKDIINFKESVVKDTTDYFLNRKQMMEEFRIKYQQRLAYTDVLNDSTSLNEHILREMFFKELMGMYNLKTSDKTIKKHENIFWRELFWNGSLLIYKTNGNVRLYRSTFVIYDSDGNLIQAQGQKLFSYYSNFSQPISIIEDLDVRFVSVFRLRPIGVPQSWFFWYKWAIDDILTVYKTFISAIRYGAKTNVIKFTGEDESAYEELLNSLKDNSNPFLVMFNSKESASLETYDYKIEKIELISDSLNMDEVNKIWNSIRDKLGMRSNSNTKKERMLLDEIAEGNVNTVINENSEIRTLLISCEELQEKLGIKVSIEKTIDLEEEKNQEKQEQQGANNDTKPTKKL